MSAFEFQYITMQVVELAKETGVFIREEAENFDLTKIEHKAKNDLVSYVDKESEKKLIKGLKEIFPDAGFIAEEGTVAEDNSEIKWVIDPLDGTTNFLHRLPPYSISIALLKGEELLLGVVYEVSKDECFYAWKEGGAYCNGKRIHASAVSSLEESLIVTGFPYSLLNREQEYFNIMKEFVSITHGVRRLGSAAVDLSYVACGRLDTYYEFNLKPWDVAAGILILQEAGGKVTDFQGGKNYLDGSEILASASGIHAKVLQVVKKHWK